MDIQVQRVDMTLELVHLCEMDEAIFGEADEVMDDPSDWEGLECYWIIVDGIQAGSFAMMHDTAISVEEDKEVYPHVPGSLYIVSTGLLPEYQHKGIGSYIKKWQIDYAKSHGFKVINTHCRESNQASFRLNAKFGFAYIGRVYDYYANPDEDAVVLEFRLKS